jgi:putative ATPase
MTNGSFEFDQQITSAFQPLAALLRPQNLSEYIGQKHILAPGLPLQMAIEQGHCHSLIFWGPPGTGKTTLAEIIAKHANAEIERVSAVTSGIKEIRQAIDNAKSNAINFQRRTVMFVDEVHRFNKSQQDAFLPHIEDGTIIFIGATTENPAFELNKAILSRARVYSLKKLTEEDLALVLNRAILHSKHELGLRVEIEEKAQQQLIALADGDARRLLNLLENCFDISPNMTIEKSGENTKEKKESAQSHQYKQITFEQITQVTGDKIALYDKGGDAFYDLISAFHKSVRGSDPDAALYWYARIINAGGDALYVARRLLAIASEDIGNADPRALQLGLNAWDTYHRVGPSEGERAIAQAAVYMALAPKSNAVYMAFSAAKALAQETSGLDVPLHLKNATSSLTKAMGHGGEYRYSHNEEGAFAAGENYFPESIADTQFYYPTDRGLEKQLKQKQTYLHELNRNSNDPRYK